MTAKEESVDPNAIRTLVVSGLPADLTKAVLWKKVRKVDDRVELLFPVEGEAHPGEHLNVSSRRTSLKYA